MESIKLKTETLLDMAKLIHLPLEEKRVEPARASAEGMINNANLLAEKMMGDEYLELIPLSVVRFPD